MGRTKVPLTQAQKERRANSIKEANQHKKAVDMSGQIVEWLRNQGETNASPANLRKIAENLDVVIEKIGLDLADFTDRRDPPSEKTKSFMSAELNRIADWEERPLDDSVFDDF